MVCIWNKFASWKYQLDDDYNDGGSDWWNTLSDIVVLCSIHWKGEMPKRLLEENGAVFPQRLKKTPSDWVNQMDFVSRNHQYSALSLFLFVLDHWLMELPALRLYPSVTWACPFLSGQKVPMEWKYQGQVLFCGNSWNNNPSRQFAHHWWEIA